MCTGAGFKQVTHGLMIGSVKLKQTKTKVLGVGV